MSLRFRLNLIMTLLIVLFAAALLTIVILDMRRSLREEMNAGGRVAQQLLTSVLDKSKLAQDPRAASTELLAFLQSLGRVRAHEIRYYHAGGWLIYTSPPSTYKAGREAPQWFTDLVAPPLMALEFATPGGRVVVIPDASRAVLDAWDELAELLWLMLGFLVAVNTIVFLLVGHFLKPLDRVLRGLSEMERGEFDARLPHFRLPEFEAMSHTFNRMAGALEASQAENRRLALIAHQSSDAIVIRDLDGGISYWNPAAERLFGYRQEEIVGRPADLLIPPDLRAESTAGPDPAKQAVGENVETRRLTRDGRLIDVALSTAPLVDPASGGVIGEISSIRDITEQKRAQEAEAELQQNRRLTQLIQTRLEEERRALARELHDELGQSVTAIRTIGTAIAQRSADAAPEIHRSARTIVDVAGRIYDVVHGIIRQLRPPALDNLGLTAALEDWLASWRDRHPQIACELSLEGNLEALGEPTNITIYRIVQECLTNVVRHADASRVEISLSRRDGRIELVVGDDGQGLAEGDAAEATFGLIGMRERVQALGGSFELESRPGAGVTMRASIPLTAPDARRGEVADDPIAAARQD